MKTIDGIRITIGHPYRANANMVDIRAARRAKYRSRNVQNDQQLTRIRRSWDKISDRRNRMKYVFGEE